MSERPCTHTELIARVVALEARLDALRGVFDERDIRYAQRSASQDSAVAAALATSEKALIKAETATEKRFDSVNEFRGTLADQATRLLPRAEYDVQHRALEQKVEINENRISALQREISGILARGGGLKDAWGYIVAFVGMVIAALTLYFRHGN